MTLTQLEKRRDSHLRRTYGITLDQYRILFQAQGGCCKVCGRHQDTFPRALAVDHDHATLEIRGLLCTYCNQRVVGRHRDPTLLLQAGKYLQGPFTGWVVPKKRPKRRKLSHASGARKKKL